MSSGNANPTKISSGENSSARSDLVRIARVFFGVAGSTWGSGGVTIARIRDELAGAEGPLTDDDFSVSYAMARIAPGTNVLALCAAVGWHIRGWMGAAVAVAALSIPAAVVCVLMTAAFERWHHFFAGAMASVVGVIVAGAFLLIRPCLTRRRLPRTLIILAAALVAGRFVSPVWVLILSGVAGYFWRES